MTRGMMGWMVAVGLAVFSPAWAEPQTDIPPAYVVAAEDNGIPPEILYAVASAESVVKLNLGRRPWPWTLNVDGMGMRFGNRASACAALRDALAETPIVDVGIAQLNVRWQPQLFGPDERFADPCDALDPYANLDEAAKLIRGHYDDTRDWLAAAGRYHRPAGGSPASRYRGIVRRELARLVTDPSSELRVASTAVASPFPNRSSVPTPSVNSVRSDPEETGLIWITPEPRSNADDVTWIDPAPRNPSNWIVEVASR